MRTGSRTGAGCGCTSARRAGCTSGFGIKSCRPGTRKLPWTLYNPAPRSVCQRRNLLNTVLKDQRDGLNLFDSEGNIDQADPAVLTTTRREKPIVGFDRKAHPVVLGNSERVSRPFQGAATSFLGRVATNVDPALVHLGQPA